MKINSITTKHFKNIASETELIYGYINSKYGECLVACINNSICAIEFVDNNNNEVLTRTKNTFKGCNFIQDDNFVSNIYNSNFNILLIGTQFQIKVWTALTTIKSGTLICYSDLATLIKQPKAVRAAASAIAKNNIAIIIPCHRVIPKNNGIGNYKWTTERKALIIQNEKNGCRE